MTSAHDTAHDAAHDTSVISKQNLLLEFCADPKSRDEMQAYIDVSSRSHFSKYYLKPLLSSGKLEMTVSRQTQKSKTRNTLPFIPNNQRSRALGLISHCPASFSFQIIFTSFTHTPNPGSQISNSAPFPAARSQPAAAPSG